MRESEHTHTGKNRKHASPGNAPALKRRLRFTALAAAVLMLFFLSACSSAPSGADVLKDAVGGLVDKVRGDDGEGAEETPQPDEESDPNDHPEPPPEEKPQTQDVGVSVDFAN